MKVRKTDRPILFRADMVRALLAGRKTQTRRILKVQPPEGVEPIMAKSIPVLGKYVYECPYGKIGDTLWVKETYFIYHTSVGEDTLYRADYDFNDAVSRKMKLSQYYQWKTSLFMPREKSRIQLRITDIRIERLCDISEADAIAEGVEINNFDSDGFIPQGYIWTYKNYEDEDDEDANGHDTAIGSFWSLWESIRPNSWTTNPFVWVINFERI